MDDTIYATSFCNRGHYLRNGRPVGHECRIIPPKALEAERRGDFPEAQRILAETPAKIVRGRKA